MDSTTTLQEIHLALIVSNNFSLCFQCSDQTAALIAAFALFGKLLHYISPRGHKGAKKEKKPITKHT